METIKKKLEEYFKKEIRSFSISFYDNGKKYIRVSYYCQKNAEYSYWKEISCTPNEVVTSFEGSDGDSWGLDHQEDDGEFFNKLSEIIFGNLFSPVKNLTNKNNLIWIKTLLIYGNKVKII